MRETAASMTDLVLFKYFSCLCESTQTVNTYHDCTVDQFIETWHPPVRCQKKEVYFAAQVRTTARREPTTPVSVLGQKEDEVYLLLFVVK